MYDLKTVKKSPGSFLEQDTGISITIIIAAVHTTIIPFDICIRIPRKNQINTKPPIKFVDPPPKTFLLPHICILKRKSTTFMMSLFRDRKYKYGKCMTDGTFKDSTVLRSFSSECGGWY